MIYSPPQKGFIALITAILISISLLTFATTVGFIAYRMRFEILDAQSKARATSLAEACFHIAILRIANDANYELHHSETVQLGQDLTCAINSIDRHNSTYEITATGTEVGFMNTLVTHLQIETEVSSENGASIISWKEVPDL